MDSTRFNWEGRNSPALLSLHGVSIQKNRCLAKVSSPAQPQMRVFPCGRDPLMLQRLSVPSLCIRTEREAQGAISKSTASALFSVLLQVSMETRMTSQSFSGEGAAFTAIQSLQLKFCKIAPQRDCFLSKKPAVQLVGGSEPLLTLPQNLAFSRSVDSAFQLDLMGEEGSQHPLLTPNPSQRPWAWRDGWSRGGQGWVGAKGCWGKAARGNTHLASGAGLVWGGQG